MDLVLPQQTGFACTPVRVANLGLEVKAASSHIHPHAGSGIDIPLLALGSEELRVITQRGVAEDAAHHAVCDRDAAHCRASGYERPPAAPFAQETVLGKKWQLQRAATPVLNPQGDRVLG